MEAVVTNQYGSPDVLRIEEIDPPQVGPDEILVRVVASSVNAYDWHMLRGKPYIARLTDGFRRPKNPRVGLDVAGVVEAVGANIDDLRPGDRVFGSRSGAFAELVSGKNSAPMPAGVSFAEAAALCTAGTTALLAVRDQGGVTQGQRVLILGAGGGVGTLAVQIAKAAGATVTAVTRTANVELVRSLGADYAIDYTKVDVTATRERYDVIVDVAGTTGLTRLGRLLVEDGRLVMVAPDPGQWIGPVVRIVQAKLLSWRGTRTFRPFLSQTSREALVDLKNLVEKGDLRSVIECTYPLDDVADAIRHVEGGGVAGKIAVTVTADG
ncbi:NAD(P)-dependent alcohol dehydrogenase [Ornithinimicrobium sp. LYQ121]|uniref:NAD(P)-dependent alcohol dehydrogenase n=1 Tax=Ornithinimicrobium sp. LYQ121 TaxID=3378801 RepID=UPI003854FD04